MTKPKCPQCADLKLKLKTAKEFADHYENEYKKSNKGHNRDLKVLQLFVDFSDECSEILQECAYACEQHKHDKPEDSNLSLIDKVQISQQMALTAITDRLKKVEKERKAMIKCV